MPMFQAVDSRFGPYRSACHDTDSIGALSALGLDHQSASVVLDRPWFADRPPKPDRRQPEVD